MSDFRDHLNSRMEDCDFKREWDAQADERQVMRKIVEARMAEGMTQVELAEACGMSPQIFVGSKTAMGTLRWQR